MALAFDAASSGIEDAIDLTLTISHTCSGVDRILIVGVGIDKTTDSITGITYAGVALTRIRAASTTNTTSSLWYLLNPTSGTNNIIVTSSSLQNFTAGGLSLTGARQFNQINASNGATGDGGGTPQTATVSVTSTLSNCWVVDCVFGNGIAAITVGAGQIERYNATNPGGQGAGSTEVAASPGSTEMSWTSNVLNQWAITAAVIIPSPLDLISKSIYLKQGFS